MDIEIDLSIQIKDPQDTVLAFSNGQNRAIVIPVSVKRAVLRELKSRYQQVRNPEMRIFVAAVFLLIKDHLKPDLFITIDKEWPGQKNEAIMKGILLNYIRAIMPDFSKDQITFASIGKGSPAHQKAYGVYAGEEEADEEVTAEDLLELLL